MSTHSLLVNYRDLPALFHLHNELEIFNTGLVRYRNFSFIVSELVQVNHNDSLAECVNL